MARMIKEMQDQYGEPLRVMLVKELEKLENETYGAVVVLAHVHLRVCISFKSHD